MQTGKPHPKVILLRRNPPEMIPISDSGDVASAPLITSASMPSFSDENAVYPQSVNSQSTSGASASCADRVVNVPQLIPPSPAWDGHTTALAPELADLRQECATLRNENVRLKAEVEESKLANKHLLKSCQDLRARRFVHN